MRYVMGIDGGGSGVRAAVITPERTVLGSAVGGSANPNSAGRELAAANIQSAVADALAAAHLSPDDLAAVGVGIAGTLTAADWVRAIVGAALPGVPLHIAADVEIALVGAHGERRGILILAGTGSVAYGVNAAGESAQGGGWGYLLGDEGSGHWIGLKALQAVVRAADGRAAPTALTDAVLRALDLKTPRDLIQWVYAPESATTRTRAVAQLAPLVLAAADDAAGAAILADAVAELALAARTVARRLHMETPQIAFAGGLLSDANPLSLGLCAALDLPALPNPKYPPVIGAAILAEHLV